MAPETQWHKVDPGDLDVGEVTMVVVADRALAITRTVTEPGELDDALAEALSTNDGPSLVEISVMSQAV